MTAPHWIGGLPLYSTSSGFRWEQVLALCQETLRRLPVTALQQLADARTQLFWNAPGDARAAYWEPREPGPHCLLFLPSRLPWYCHEGALGTLAHEFASVVAGHSDLSTLASEEEADALAISWGFAAEIRTVQDQLRRRFLPSPAKERVA